MPRKKQAVHASGLIEVKVTVGKTNDGKRIQKSFYGTSKLAARNKADEYITQQAIATQTGQVIIEKDFTFSQWAQKWLETKKNTVKQSTFDTTYKSKIDKYIVPYFENMSLQKIKQIDIQGFFNHYHTLSKSTQNKLRIILYGIFDLAVDNDLCFKNPVKNIRLSDTEPQKKRVYTLQNANQIIEYCTIHDIIDILILIETGIRRSELLALTWQDVDFEQKLIHINSAVTSNKGKPIEAKTKSNSSTRDIPIGDTLINAIKSHQDSGYIVKGKDGGFMSPSGYTKHYKATMAQVCTTLGIEALNPHELRHTYGTLLRERGVDIYTIQKLMGHADIGITAKIYVHNDIEVLRKAMKLT